MEKPTRMMPTEIYGFSLLDTDVVSYQTQGSRHGPDWGMKGKPSKHHDAYNTTNKMPPKHTYR